MLIQDHEVINSDYQFTYLGRPFKFTSAIYYKKLWDIIPFEMDNLSITYLTENNAKGYATGLDLNSTIPNDGDNLIPLLEGKKEFKNRALYWHYPNFAFHRDNRLGSAIREGDHKLLHFYDTDSIELYDLKKDIGKKNDLSDEMPQLAQRLKGKLSSWLKASGALMPTKR